MAQLQSTSSLSPNQERAWLDQLARETKLVADAQENFDFTVAHSMDFLSPDVQVAAARGKLFRALQDLLEWYRAGPHYHALVAA